ncbi:hypothetical protein HK099_004153 [Clydaea vesicula]|uniref:Uncharacterized protein n=1 Tax=Clydaea vesicula TaxID=447962 RepID=A0AAD5U5B8_9FUNG|nr:hypothetical protein HK099_004153 [Clydaea vesicula]KAJ3387393.1 hypothetical protein HDU92_001971 [Lobulomyces angularis]
MSDNIAHAISGAAGGMLSMALTYPLITVSTRNQVQRQNNEVDERAYKGQLDAFKRILKEEGIPGLYSGLNSALFGIAITQGVYYYWYEKVKAIYEGKDKRAMSTLESMTSGAIAGVATSIFTNPIWVVNTRLTVKNEEKLAQTNARKKKTGLIAAILKIFKEEGIKGFYRGILPALILVSNPIIQYTVFEKLKEKLMKFKKELGATDFFILGALSKLAATSITFPYILIKSRMQLKQTEEERYKSPVDGFRKIVKAEGVKGLYKGIESKLLQSVLTSALLFAFKEEFYQFAVTLLVLVGARNKKI